MKEIQRRIEKEVGNCNGKYDRMVNHHFALLISRPRGNRACFIQQFIRSPSILALNTLSPRRSTVHCVYRSAQQRNGLSADLPAIISDRRQNSQTSLQTVYRLNQHHCSYPFTESSIAAVSTNPPNITHRRNGRGTEVASEKGWDSSTRQGTNGSLSCETLALCRNMLAIWKRQ